MKAFKTNILVFFLILIMTAGLMGASKATLDQDLLKSFKYRSIGPTRQSGRFVDFAVVEKDPYTFYAATASGGLWKTENNGITFTPLFTDEKVFSIGAVALDQNNPQVIWVGTGEANNSRSTYWGDGIYKSNDGGKTWTNMGLKESHHIGRIVMHPNNPDILYVSCLGHLYSDNPERGLYRTMDGGKSWEKVLGPVVRDKHIGVADVAINPKNPDILYAATYDKVRKPYTFNLGGPGSAIYKSMDSGKTWKKLSSGLPGGMLGRIGLAVYPKNPDILFACVENANKKGMSQEEREKELLEDKSSQGMIDGEVYRSDDGGDSWKKISPEDKNIGGAPGYYYGRIIVDPNNDKVVHVLSAASWGTYDGGKTWLRRPFNFGGDDHALWINPKDSRHILLGYDHGMGVSFDGGKNWLHPDNLSLAQFYAVGVDMSYPYRIAGGLQDNGSHLGPSVSRRLPSNYDEGSSKSGSPILFEDWVAVGGGDGMYNVFDWKTNRYLYNESQFGVMNRVDLETGEITNIGHHRIDKKMRWNWNSPILVSQHNSDVIYHAGNMVLKSTYRGENWKAISPDLTTNDPKKLTTGKGGDGNIQYCTITSMDESIFDANELWVGTDDGNVQLTRDGGKTWKKLNDNIKGNPGYWVSRIVASKHHPGTAYLTYTGYRRDDFKPFVYMTGDYGVTWKSIASNLPEAPINVIREDHNNPNLLFVGSEFGVYMSMDRGSNWIKMKLNMPNQPVHDMVIHPRENDLVVATHGRGIYITDITALQELSQDLLAKPFHLFKVEPKVKWVLNKHNASSFSNFKGEGEPNAVIINYYLSKKQKGEVTLAIYHGSKLINQFKGKNERGIHKIQWDMNVRKKRTEEEKKKLKSRLKRWAAYGYTPDIDMEYSYSPALEGDYTVVLTVGKKKVKAKATILKDQWYK